MGVNNNQLLFITPHDDNTSTLNTFDIEEDGTLKLVREKLVSDSGSMEYTIQGAFFCLLNRVDENGVSITLLDEYYEPFMEIPNLNNIADEEFGKFTIDVEQGYYYLLTSASFYDTSNPPVYFIYDIKKQDLLRDSNGSPQKKQIEFNFDGNFLETEKGFLCPRNT